MIRKRDKLWQVDVQVGGERFRKSVRTLAEAEVIEREARERLEKGLAAQDPEQAARATTLEQLRAQAFARYWAGKPNERTARINSLDVVNTIGASRSPDSITTHDVDNLVAVLRKRKNSDATINRKLACLSKLLKHGHERGLVPVLPRIERMRESQGRLRWYTDAEMDRILGHLEVTGRGDFRDVVVFLVDTGCRASEVARLEWRDYDAKGGAIHLYKTKSGKDRLVPLTVRARGLLDARAARRVGAHSPTSLVFPGWTDNMGRTLPLSALWAQVAKELKLDDEAVLHCLRHTYASRLVQAGVGLNVVQTLLGHSTPSMTMRYAHLANHNLTSAVATLDGDARVTSLRTESAAVPA